MMTRCSKLDCTCPTVSTFEALGATVTCDEWGEVHSADGPAVVWSNGGAMWMRHGLHHRVDGPAWVDANGRSELWNLAGKPVAREVVIEEWLVANAAHADRASAEMLEVLSRGWQPAWSLGMLWDVVAAATRA